MGVGGWEVVTGRDRVLFSPLCSLNILYCSYNTAIIQQWGRAISCHNISYGPFLAVYLIKHIIAYTAQTYSRTSVARKPMLVYHGYLEFVFKSLDFFP